MQNLTAVLLATALTTPVAAQQSSTPSVRVTGLLLDEHGAPAVGVAIGLATAAAPDSATALASPVGSSGADGLVSLEIPVAASTRTLVLGGKPFATYECALRPDARSVELGTVALAPGVTGIGRVRDPEGRPLAGAAVECLDLLDSRTFLRDQRTATRLACRSVATSGENGIFRLAGMVASAGEVRVRCAGYADAFVVPAAAGTPLDVTLHPARTVRGRVVGPDDAALGGVRVRSGNATATTADDGSFSLTLRDRHTASLFASLRRNDTSLTGRAAIPLDEEAVELRLGAAGETSAPGSVQVKAIAADGATIRTFDAWIVWKPRNQLRFHTDSMLFLGTGRTDGSHATSNTGQVSLAGSLQAREDVGVVFVRTSGHGLGRLEIDRSAIGTDPVVVQLPRPGVLQGKVVDATGAPLGGARVIATLNASESLRQHLLTDFFQVESMLDAPTQATTAADGTWRIEGLPPGQHDVFLHAPGRARVPSLQVELAEGAAIEDLTIAVPDNRALRGRLLGPLPPGTSVRVHWHRPNMSSSAWAFEFDGASPVAADGTFSLADLPPRLYRVELLLPAPPRGGMPVKLACGEWDGAAAPDEVASFASPELAMVRGRVAGEVPWSRLAVLATWRNGDEMLLSEFAPHGPMTLVGRDRSFSMALPARDLRLILLDPFSGIALGFVDIAADDLSKPVTFTCTATPLTLRLTDEVPDAQRPCTLQYVPAEEHWPLLAQTDFAIEQRAGMKTELRSGGDVPLWLPAPSGALELTCDGITVRVDAAALRGDLLEFRAGAGGLQQVR